jgi:hypothetical protein
MYAQYFIKLTVKSRDIYTQNHTRNDHAYNKPHSNATSLIRVISTQTAKKRYSRFCYCLLNNVCDCERKRKREIVTVSMCVCVCVRARARMCIKSQGF